MPKKLVTNIYSALNSGVSKKVLLYDAKTNGCIKNINQPVTLVDSINNYDIITIEVIAHDDANKFYYINDHHIITKYIVNEEPLTHTLSDHLNSGYLISLATDDSGNVRQLWATMNFESDTSFKLSRKSNYAKLAIGIRNIYGINFGASSIYSDKPMKMGTWVDGKIVYRSIIDFGTIDIPVGTVSFPFNIPNIDNIITYQIFARNNTGTTYNLPYVMNGTLDTYASISQTEIQIMSNNRWTDHACWAIIDYTKKEEENG